MCTRPHSYPASIAPVLFGATYALGYESKFSILKFILFLLACLLIQAATNLFNEYYDYKHGLDKVDSEGISGSIVKGNLSPKEVMVGALVLYALAFAPDPRDGVCRVFAVTGEASGENGRVGEVAISIHDREIEKALIESKLREYYPEYKFDFKEYYNGIPAEGSREANE